MHIKIMFDENKKLFVHALYEEKVEQDINGTDIYRQYTGYFKTEEEARKDAELWGLPIENGVSVFKSVFYEREKEIGQ